MSEHTVPEQPSTTPEPEQVWDFTFGSGQRFDGRYVTITGTYESARAEMVRHFGTAWCDQYRNREASGINQFGLQLLPRDEWPIACAYPGDHEHDHEMCRDVAAEADAKQPAAQTIAAPDAPRYPTTPAQIAAALRRAADTIAAIGDVELSPTAVTLNLQVVKHGSALAEERVATVDTLLQALIGVDGEFAEDINHHWTPYAARDARVDLTVSVFTGLPDTDERTGSDA